MSNEYADVVLTSLSSPLLGKITLNDAAKIKVDEEVTRTAVKTMNRRRKARGYKSGTKSYTAELVVEVQMPEEIDWGALFEFDDQFLLTYELGDGGGRYQLVDCIVGSTGLEGDEEGNVQRTISLQALNHRPASGRLF